MLDEILALKEEQRKARVAKQVVANQLRNAERRRKRLKMRAKQLSDQDLLAVMSLRNAEKALGRHDPVLVEEDDDEDTESEQDDSATAAGTSSAVVESPSRPKRQARGR